MQPDFGAIVVGSDPLEASRFHWFFCLAGEGQTPFRIGSKTSKKEKNTKEDKKFFADTSADLDKELAEWIVTWNNLKSDGLVSSRTSVKPNKGVRAAWSRVKKDSELGNLLADRNAIVSAIRTSECVRNPWFTLEKLLGGTNKEGTYIAQQLLNGCYTTNAKTTRTANVGRGVTFSTSSAEGDPNYGQM